MDEFKGYVFNIQQFSVHDGPGIRTLVFLKGCPLRCQWCSNPESQQFEPELAYNPGKCIGADQCQWCRRVCSVGALGVGADGKITIDRSSCRQCFQCAAACPAKALNVFGRVMTVDEVLREVERDGVFYARSGGGLTVSGGEPLLQGKFTAALLAEAKRRRLNTAIETSGFGEWQDLELAARHLDTVMYDIKCLDPARHKQFTGVDNARILTNLRWLRAAFPQLAITVRTPVVPGFNDNPEEIAAIIDFLRGIPGVTYELLAYHRLGQPKYGYLGRDYPLGDAKLDDQRMRELKALAAEFNHNHITATGEAS